MAKNAPPPPPPPASCLALRPPYPLDLYLATRRPCPNLGVLTNEDADAGDDGKENDAEDDDARGVTRDNNS
nr:unnamed protein product [Digitaria exilis]